MAHARPQGLPLSAMILTAVLMGGGCEQVSEQVASPEPRIMLSVKNLRPLPQGEGHYTLWAGFFDFAKMSSGTAFEDEERVSLGDFNIGSDGSLLGPDGGPVRFRIPTGLDPQLVRDVIVTIATENLFTHLDDEPGAPIMGGSMRGDERFGMVDLTSDFDEAIGVDLSRVEGQYALLAPSSPVRGDSNAGVWFVDVSATIAVGLRGLPALNEHWIYEGWVADDRSGIRVHYSTGTFRYADSADADGAGPGKGPGSGLNFPGQDFITGPLARPDLSLPGFWFMITLEPVPDNAPGPFSFVLLDSRHPATDAHMKQSYPLFRPSTTAGVMYNQIPVSSPTGTLTIVR